MPVPLKKKCYRCKQVKLLDDFYHNRTKPDYYNDVCKEYQKAVDKKSESG